VSNLNVTDRRKFLTSAGLLAAGMAANALGAVPLAPPDAQPAHLPIPQPAGKKIGYAIVGLGELALTQVMPAFALCEHARPVAVVSGHRDKAEKVADHYQIDRKAIYDYKSYESMKDNPAIDVVYVILPNSMHAEYTIRAFAAGKHVLCEKPMAVTSDECRKMIDAGQQAGKKLMIAYRLRHEPFNQAMIDMGRKQAYGKIIAISSENMQNTQAPNIRLSKDLGGGPLGDLGIYCLNAARYVTGEEPIEVSGMSYADPSQERFREVPETVVFSMKFPSGVLAQCTASFGSERADRLRVVCEKGVFELEPAFGYTGQKLKVKEKKNQTEITLSPVNHFAKEMDYLADCVLNDKPVLTAGEEGLADMKIIEAINQAIADKKAIQIT